MLSQSQGRPKPKSCDWEDVTLHGGPHAGQIVCVPTDETRLRFYFDGEPHTYVRLSIKPVFMHEPDAARLLGGGA